MKKNYWYILLIAFFISAVSFVVINYKQKKDIKLSASFPLLTRKDSTSKDEWLSAKKNTDKLLAKIKANPRDTTAALALANAYIMEARINGNISYYDNAAMKQVENVLAIAPGNYEALLLKSLLQLSQHHFAEGLATARIAESINTNNAFVHGLLVDAHVEMGNYEDAVDAADKMVSARPDLRSYSRISYLREIHGDYPGAINAMELAVQAGLPGEEGTEWCRAQLGRLYEHTGNVSLATDQYQLSLAARPSYAYALAGMARLSTFKKQHDSAVYYLEQAQKASHDADIQQSLATAYLNAAQTDKATALTKEVIAQMNINTNSTDEDPTLGHYSDKELAYAYLQQNNYEKALAHALAEYNRRPKNIEINETMAWVYYQKGDFGKALPYVEEALKTHSMNPKLLCSAGLIYAKTGNAKKAKTMLGLGLRQHPVIDADLQKESELVLKNL
ncbi:MAG: tetratricopeptide repeat protein [Gloeobacteraceae cyanobacterium ES-bin-316]|nr:tetratricopeptide repeat protein [Ferruginibacter sp.]